VDSKSEAVFGNLQWLSFFQSDWSRLLAIGFVSIALIAIFCVPKLAKVWASDRSDQRSHERRKLALTMAVDEEIARRREGGPGLDV
jgi:hypothetical protein